MRKIAVSNGWISWDCDPNTFLIHGSINPYPLWLFHLPQSGYVPHLQILNTIYPVLWLVRHLSYFPTRLLLPETSAPGCSRPPAQAPQAVLRRLANMYSVVVRMWACSQPAFLSLLPALESIAATQLCDSVSSSVMWVWYQSFTRGLLQGRNGGGWP